MCHAAGLLHCSGVQSSSCGFAVCVVAAETFKTFKTFKNDVKCRRPSSISEPLIDSAQVNAGFQDTAIAPKNASYTVTTFAVRQSL
jgi:hypothetical protein